MKLSMVMKFPLNLEIIIIESLMGNDDTVMEGWLLFPSIKKTSYC